ncbi:MAG: oligosaccharide flippase family protein [Proteobacteria bacterium]|nr:oligosaccharide flippase family protein [Pseudomonadota bacterium]
MTKTLKQRAVRSGSWVIGGHLISQILRLSSNLILTRLLVPEMFGVMAIVTVIMFGLAMFSDVGLLQNIVQSKRGEEPSYLNTAWTIQIIRGFLIFFIALLASVAMYYAGKLEYFSPETVYGNKQLPVLLAVVSITAVISSFNSIHIPLLNRKLMLGKLITIELTSQIVGLVFMLIWAWYQRDVWALAFGGIVAAFTKMLISHTINLGERCEFHWDREAVYEIFHFGKWIFISSILGFLLSQGDRLLLGFWVSSEKLGVYSVAFFLAMALKDMLKKVVGSVFYPMLSEIARDNPDQLRGLYYRIRAKVDFIAMLTAGLMASMGHVVINILYDDRYAEAGWMIEILSFSLIFIGYSMAGVCLMAKGNSKSNMWLTLIATIFLYVSVPIAYSYYGLYGAVVMISLNFIIDIPSTFYMLKKYDLLLLSKEFRMLPVLGLSYGSGVLAVSLFGF